MRRRSAFLLALAVVGAPLCAVADPAKAPAQQAPLSAPVAEAARVLDAFHAALGRGDTAAALALLADDALIFEEGGAERGKAEYAAHHLAADAAFAQAVPSTRARRTGHSHGELAALFSEGRTRGAYKGKAVDRLTTETALLRRDRGRWVIVHLHWSSRGAPAS